MIITRLLRNKYFILLLVVILILWVQEMTASSIFTGRRVDSFFVIFTPLSVLFAFFYKSITKYICDRSRSFSVISSIVLFFVSIIVFLIVSFGERNKICFSGDCENGFGYALYKSSERSGIDYISSDTIYSDGDFLGLVFFNNVTWYDQNPIDEIYEGEFKDGKFDGNGQLISLIYNYNSDTYEQTNVKGALLFKGVFKKGFLVESLYGDTLIHLSDESTENVLYNYFLDHKGKRNFNAWE